MSTYELYESNHQRIAHHEGAMPIGHPCGPVVGKPVEPLELRGVSRSDRPSGVRDDVLEPRRGRSAFSGQDRPGRAVRRVRECDRSLVVRRTRCPFLATRSTLFAPLRYAIAQLLLGHEEVSGNRILWLKDVSQDPARSRSNPPSRLASTPLRSTSRLRPRNGVVTRPHPNSWVICAGCPVVPDRDTAPSSATTLASPARMGSAEARTPSSSSHGIGPSHLVRHLRHAVGDDEHAPAPLREAVVRGVHDAPLDQIPEVGEAREDDREVAAALVAGDFRSRSTFSRKT